MEVIVTHDMADFDALASVFAAKKLHPGAAVLLGPRMGQEVRGYLALHRERFPTTALSEVDPATVSHVVVVDVRRKSRLSDYGALIERAERGRARVTIYDHHPAADDDLRGDEELVQPVGSTITLLVERMVSEGVEVDDVEATLYALGIHADTGSLTYAGTTPRDARALAWLLERGASLLVLARYLRPGFSAEQRALLARMLQSLDLSRVGHLEVAYALLELPHAVSGFAEVVSEVSALTNYAAVIAVFGIGRKRVQVVARSRTPLLDVGRVVSSVGGGGHASAASGLLKHADPREVLKDLRRAIEEQPPRARRVCEIMTSPVHTISPETRLSELARLLASLRYTGMPVLQAGRLVGIVSHRDVERAEREGRAELPVSSCMTRDVHGIDADAAPDEALATMEREDVGRLPVLRDGRLVGIVTRSDLLKVLYD